MGNNKNVTPRRRQTFALIVVLLVAAVLRLWNLHRDGFGYPYYAAAARSMSESGHNFFFVAFDGAGAVAVDKPPLALWVQAISVRLCGWHGFSLLLPSVLAGLGTIALLYQAVKQTHGYTAGLIAACVLALTPISVAVDRVNLPDPFLHLFLVGSACCVLHAAQTGRPALLVLAALLIGAGFHTKMGGALVVVPGFGLAFLLGGGRGNWKKRVRPLIAATLLLIPACFWWVWTVDSIPPASRPYIAGSGNNTARGLLSGYNGWGRISGTGLYQLTPDVSRRFLAQNPVPLAFVRRGFSQPFDGGTPGPARLLRPPVAPLIGWLYPLAFWGLAILLTTVWSKPNVVRASLSSDQSALFVWGGWLILLSGVFSIARGTFHPYYVAALAPPIAALVGIGAAELWTRFTQIPGATLRRLVFPFVLLLSAAWQTGIARRYIDWGLWLIPIILLGGGGVAALLVALAAEEATENKTRPQVACVAACIAGIVFLLAPLVWALTPIRGRNSPILPTAGPEVTTGYAFSIAPGAPPAWIIRTLASYLKTQQKHERFLLATGTTFIAAPLMIETGRPVLAMGGFTGGDMVVTPRDLARLVASGQLRFLLVTHWEAERSPENLPSRFGWAQKQGRVVPLREWCPVAARPGNERWARAVGDWTLYDCRPSLLIGDD